MKENLVVTIQKKSPKRSCVCSHVGPYVGFLPRCASEQRFSDLGAYDNQSTPVLVPTGQRRILPTRFAPRRLALLELVAYDPIIIVK
jgi:hypothetical protein